MAWQAHHRWDGTPGIHFRCTVDDKLIRGVVDAFVSLGLDERGYKYANIDDCWASTRDENGQIVPDPQTFPEHDHDCLGIVSRGQPLPLDEGRVWSTDVDLLICSFCKPSQVDGIVCQVYRRDHHRLWLRKERKRCSEAWYNYINFVWKKKQSEAVLAFLSLLGKDVFVSLQ